MKVLYEASNAIEAYMIVNLLEQAGLFGRIDGEYLQGGAGELQASGMVRVMIDETEYPKAKEIVDKWDAQQPADTPTPTRSHPNTLVVFVTGIICGMAVMAVFCPIP